MRPPSFHLEPEDFRLRERLSDSQLDRLHELVLESRVAGRPISLLSIHSPKDPAGWLDPSATVLSLGDHLFLAVLPRCHIDRGSAIAERLVRLARDPRVRVGVAQVLPHSGRLDSTLERAQQALEEAVAAGPVACMHWADASRETLPAI